MIKHVNFTGRRRIPRDCVEVVLYDGAPRRFDARIDLQETKLPDGAKVFLEAMRAGSSAIQRFDCGRIGSLVLQTRSLDDVDGDNVFFALKVVDDSERVGRILGLAENIRPKQADKRTPEGRQGILPIVPAALGQELWRVEFTNASRVTLLVNEELSDAKDRLRTDPLWQAAIYPAAVRIILKEALSMGATGDREEDEQWASDWLRFGRGLHPDNASPPVEDEEQRDVWIEEVAAAFCSHHKLMEKLQNRLQQQEGDLA